MRAREGIGWVVGTLVVAVTVHIASVCALPHSVMHMALQRMGSVNTIHHQSRVTAKSRGVVRPSPDLLYSVCPFDLSQGALRIHAPIPPDTYWSVSGFDDNTDNFFAQNDQQTKDSVVDFLIVLKGTHPNTEGFTVVTAPTARGLVLFRSLINDEKNFVLIDSLRRQATCTPWHASLRDISSGG